MNIPGFGAQASLYRTRNRYRAAGAAADISGHGESIHPAYMPGPETQRRCNEHIEGCLEDAGTLLATLSAACGLGCIAAGRRRRQGGVYDELPTLGSDGHAKRSAGKS